MSSEYWKWWVEPKGATMSLAKLHPALERIHMQQRPRDWRAWVVIGDDTFEATGPTRPEALAELLNSDDLIEALGRWEDR